MREGVDKLGLVRMQQRSLDLLHAAVALVPVAIPVRVVAEDGCAAVLQVHSNLMRPVSKNDSYAQLWKYCKQQTTKGLLKRRMHELLYTHLPVSMRSRHTLSLPSKQSVRT